VKRVVTLLAAGLLFAGVGALPAGAQGGGNAAVAINTKDGSALFKLAFSIRHVMGDVVDESNAAVAFASCTDCQTVAVAIQIVLVMGNPSLVDPTNLALAFNYQCDLCITFADAMQWVFSTGGPIHFTAEGNRELAEIRQELEQLKKENLPLDQLTAKLDDIKARIANILRTQLVPAGQSGPAQNQQTTQPAQSQPGSTEPSTTGATTETTPTTSTESTTTDTTTTPTTTGP
jgi:putative peptide zinc metalloprotease protein